MLVVQKQHSTAVNMTLEGGDCFDNQYHVHIRRLLTFIGLWPYVKPSIRLLYVLVISTVLVSAFGTVLYLIVIAERKMEPMLELLEIFIAVISGAFIYWSLLYNYSLVKEIVEHIRRDWNEVKCQKELNIMEAYGAQSKLYSQMILYASILYVAFLIFPSITRFFLHIFGIIDKTKLILPFPIEFFLLNGLTYPIAFLLELIVILTKYMIGLTNYTMFISFLQHACSLFVIVTNKIDEPFIKSEVKFSLAQIDSKCETEFKWIVTVIQNYDNAIKFVKLTRLLYENMFIVDVQVALWFIIRDFIYLFQLPNAMKSVTKLLKICSYINCSLLMIYGYSYLGEKLIEHSGSVYEKCCMVPFYKLSVRTNKLFLSFIIRCMKPCNISIKGIIVASHDLFAKIIKASFSFATVCYNMG